MHERQHCSGDVDINIHCMAETLGFQLRGVWGADFDSLCWALPRRRTLRGVLLGGERAGG